MSRVFTQRISKPSRNFMEREYILVEGRRMTETMEREKRHTQGRGASFPLSVAACSLLASAPRMLNNARVILFGRGPLLLLLDASLSTHPGKKRLPHLHRVSLRRTTFGCRRLVTTKSTSAKCVQKERQTRQTPFAPQQAAEWRGATSQKASFIVQRTDLISKSRSSVILCADTNRMPKTYNLSSFKKVR
jgi:hypothetical protein